MRSADSESKYNATRPFPHALAENMRTSRMRGNNLALWISSRDIFEGYATLSSLLPSFLLLNTPAFRRLREHLKYATTDAILRGGYLRRAQLPRALKGRYGKLW